MTGLRVVGPLDPLTAWDGATAYTANDKVFAPGGPLPTGLRGAAGTLNGTRLVRDPLGLDKLFWADTDVAARPWRLVAEGHALADIRSVPRGTVVDVDTNETIMPPAWADRDHTTTLEEAATGIGSDINGYLAGMAAAHPTARAYVCLSGGLDSSGVAALCRRHFTDVLAVSFDLAGGPPSDDRLVATRLAADLGLELLEVTVTPDELLDHLDTVLREGIDWRDFNVHCGLVNAALAEAIAAQPTEGLVVTGDLANEFLVDYQPERYGGRTYYELPNIRPSALRTSLVRGLDSTHREVGVFGGRGLTVLQPYAVAADHYLALPDDLLAADDRKSTLARRVLGDLLPDYIYDRPKVRAQVGTEGAGGVLGVCVDRGIDADRLRRRFAELHGVVDPAELDRFVRAGVYRSAVPSPAGAVGERA